MTTDVKGTTSRCNRLLELPCVLTEWQHEACCPDCDYYDDGQCCKALGVCGSSACPFDGKALPLREVTVETPKDPARRPLDVEPDEAPEGRLRFQAVEQDVKLRIADRTGRRIRALVVELTERELVVRGTASCYYLKQLALHAAMDALASAREMVTLRLEVGVVPPVEKVPATLV